MSLRVINREVVTADNEQPQGISCGIEDFSLKSLRMRGNKSPAPPAESAPRSGVLNPKKAAPLRAPLETHARQSRYAFRRTPLAAFFCQKAPPYVKYCYVFGFKPRPNPLRSCLPLVSRGTLKYYDLLPDYRKLRKGESTAMYYKANTVLKERVYDYLAFIKTLPELGIVDFWLKREGGFVLTSILKDSIADTVFGLNPGDIIPHINGKPALTYSKSEPLDPKFYLSVEEWSILGKGKVIHKA
jgi:hypothetical protein